MTAKTENSSAEPLHLPVLLPEVLEMLGAVIDSNPEQKFRYFDGTFGRGGHLKALLEKYPNLSALAMDQDPEAIEYGRKNFADWIDQGRLEIVHGNFAEFSAEKFGQFDLMLLDLGVSSPQLDQGQRGFSFYHDGPLDMRMDTTKGPTAADLI